MRENFGCVKDGLVEYLVGCSKVSCGSQAWSAQWRWQWYWLFCDLRFVTRRFDIRGKMGFEIWPHDLNLFVE